MRTTPSLLVLLLSASLAGAGEAAAPSAPAAPAAPAAAPKAAAPKAAPKAASSSAFKTEDQRILYALGAVLAARSVSGLSLTADEYKYLAMGYKDGALSQKFQADIQEYGPKIDGWANARMAAKAAKEKEKGKAFLEKAAKEAGAQKSASGLIYTELKAGAGESPKETDSVKASYEGKLINGTVFDASARHGGPVDFELNRVVKCWTEGIQKMKVGGKARLVCPSDIAYGDQPNGQIPAGATLIFDVELVGINKK